LDIDANRIVHVSAKDKLNGKQQELRLDYSSALPVQETRTTISGSLPVALPVIPVRTAATSATPLGYRPPDPMRNIAIGGTLFAIGTLVTALTYSGAQGRGGGTYIIAWGAMLFGGLQLLIGLGQTAAALFNARRKR